MTWAKVDDGLHGHVKPLRAGLEAMGLWVLCLSYAGFAESDGLVEREVVERLAGGIETATRLAERLVRAGLWEPDAAGWRFHDWRDCNLTAQQLADLRRKRAKAGRKGGLAKKKQVLSDSQADPDPDPDPSPDPGSRTPPLSSLSPPAGGPSEREGKVRKVREGETAAPPADAPAETVDAWCRAHGLPAPSSDESVRAFLAHAQKTQRRCARWADAWLAWQRRSGDFDRARQADEQQEQRAAIAARRPSTSADPSQHAIDQRRLELKRAALERPDLWDAKSEKS